MSDGEMRVMFKKEYHRMKKSISFKLCSFAGVAFAVFHSIYVYFNLFLQNEQRLHEIMNADDGLSSGMEWYEMGILQGWLGTEAFSGYNNIFFLVFPLLASIPFGASLYYGDKNGYADKIAIKQAKQYYIVKYLVTFLSGGFSVSIPLVTSLIIAACYLPAVGTDPLALQTMVSNRDMFADLFFDAPILYALIFIVVDFILGGFFACMTLVISGWCRNGIIAVIFPALLNTVLTRIVFVSEGFEGIRSYVPGYFMNPSPEIAVYEFAKLFATCLIMGLALAGLYILNVHVSMKKERVRKCL